MDFERREIGIVGTLEATPKGLDLDKVRDHIREVSGVVEVHDLHAWTNH